MNEVKPGSPAKNKFQTLSGTGSACLAVGILISFTVIGLPLGIPLILAGIVLLAISPLFKAKHLVRGNDGNSWTGARPPSRPR